MIRYFWYGTHPYQCTALDGQTLFHNTITSYLNIFIIIDQLYSFYQILREMYTTNYASGDLYINTLQFLFKGIATCLTTSCALISSSRTCGWGPPMTIELGPVCSIHCISWRVSFLKNKYKNILWISHTRSVFCWFVKTTVHFPFFQHFNIPNISLYTWHNLMLICLESNNYFRAFYKNMS